jgi:hypothetical protein
MTTLVFAAGARVGAQQGPCDATPPATFTVTLPKLGAPPDDEGLGWDRPDVWAGHFGVLDDSIEVPNGRPIYALFVSGYRQNADLDELIFYNFARHLQAQGAYVHWAWWNNLLAPYMERPLHTSQSHPGTDLTNFTTQAQAANKAVPGEDYQFVEDAKRLLRAIRDNNPSAMIIVVGHSMGGSAVVHLASQSDVVIDIVAPIDPVNNRNFPWAGPFYQGTYHYNWTRWRVTRNNFLGYRDRRLIDLCDPSGSWLANINDAFSNCPAGIVVHQAGVLRFGSNVINLHHRWQNEATFPFDYEDTYTFNHTRPPGGTTSQSAVTTRAAGSDPGGWPLVNPGGECCPSGGGVGWSADGHGEIVGFRGPIPPQPLGVRVSTSPNCSGCSGLTWPARTYVGGTWHNGNSSSREAILRNLESLPSGQTWLHEPYNPDLCLVSQGLINRFNSMNKPPVARAGPDLTVTCQGCSTAAVTLDGSASTDPDNDSLVYRWTWNLGSASGAVATINLPVGTHCITLEVEDPSGHIARDVVAITISDPSAHVVPYTSLASAWKQAAGEYEARAFDEFYPGAAGALRCLLNPSTAPATIALARGTLTVSALRLGTPVCAITDSSTTPAVSDASIMDQQSVSTFEFEPAVSAFYTYYGSLASGRVATMRLLDQSGALVSSITTPPSAHSSLAAGQGFTSTIPIKRIEFSSDEPGGVLVGAFVGLRSGEPSLGTVNLGNYSGPGGSGVIQLDFACTFVAACPADFDRDGTATPADVAAFVNAWLTSLTTGTLAGDFDGNGAVEPADVAAFLNVWFATVAGGGC